MALARSLLSPPTRRELVLLLSFLLTLILLLQPYPLPSSLPSALGPYRAYLPLPLGSPPSPLSTSHTRPQHDLAALDENWEVVKEPTGEIFGDYADEGDEEEDFPPTPPTPADENKEELKRPAGAQSALREMDALRAFGRETDPAVADVRTVWGDLMPPLTKLVSHTPGFTIFQNLYILNGTTYIVSNNPSALPERRMMTGSGAGIYNSPAEIAAQEPTDKDMRIVSPAEAKQLFGEHAVRLRGNSFLTNDPSQLIAHYYHFTAELLFGIWRTYASLDDSISPTGSTRLPAPRRWLFPHLASDSWRDYAAMNQYVMFATMPSTQLLFQHDWEDWASMGRPFLLERVVYSDRSAAIRGEEWLPKQRMAALAFDHPHAKNWWAPVRSNVVRFAGGDINFDPHPILSPGAPASAPAARDPPVITYVSRQTWGRRMLRQEDHEGLVRALEGLREQYGYEVNVVNMDQLTRDEQIRLAGRTTILCGVHGNGLTSLLWMKPTPRTTVMEFFIPQGWAYDYEWTARALGMTHYGWWNDTYVTYPNMPIKNNYPDGFQGNEIPLDGNAVAAAMHARLSLVEEADE